ncbi:MAG: AMP-binding protein [Rhodoferax sp.]|nr:AMP-binding protein [Rhodoferax sp.]
MLIRTIERHPDCEALVAGSALDHQSGNSRIHRAANSFPALGIRPCDRMITFVQAGEAVVTSFMVCQKLDAIAVPVNFRSLAGELTHILRDSDARAMVFSAERADVVAQAMAYARQRCGDRNQLCAGVPTRFR